MAVLATRRFPNDLASGAEGRRFVEAALATYSPDLVGVAALLTTELITNAVVHGHSVAEVTIERGEGSITITVVDENQDIPVVTDADALAGHGRGLALVRDLSADWGFNERIGSKCVWFRLTDDDGTRNR